MSRFPLSARVVQRTFKTPAGGCLVGATTKAKTRGAGWFAGGGRDERPVRSRTAAA